MATFLTTLLIVGVIVVAFGISIWLLLALAIFLGAATMADRYDDFPTNEDFEEYDRKKK